MKITADSFTPKDSKGFIVIEGVNGAGKSSLQFALRDWVEEQGCTALCSLEPGGTPIGKSLRELLLQQASSSRKPLTEALLFSADRHEHVQTVIRPALEQGQLVLLDRYYYSTLAFQGFGHQTELEPLIQLSEIATDRLKPDLVILLDLDPEEGLRRNRDKSEVDSFEQEKLEFHQRLREGFLHLADSLSEPFLVIDATLPQEEVFAEALRCVSAVVEARQ